MRVYGCNYNTIGLRVVIVVETTARCAFRQRAGRERVRALDCEDEVSAMPPARDDGGVCRRLPYLSAPRFGTNGCPRHSFRCPMPRARTRFLEQFTSAGGPKAGDTAPEDPWHRWI